MMPINQLVTGSALKRSLLPALGMVLIAMGMAIAGQESGSMRKRLRLRSCWKRPFRKALKRALRLNPGTGPIHGRLPASKPQGSMNQPLP